MTTYNKAIYKEVEEEGFVLVDKDKLMKQKPCELHRLVNRFDQEVIFYEHPTKGDEAPVIGVIGDTAFNTGFWDCGSFFEDSDYNPILFNGIAICSFQVDTYLIEKGIFDKKLLGNKKN